MSLIVLFNELHACEDILLQSTEKKSVNVTIMATVQHGLSYEIFEQKDSEGNSYCSQELQ